MLTGMRLEEEARDNAEIAAAAANCPEPIGILRLARRHEASICQNDVSLREGCDRQAVTTGEYNPVPPPSVSPATPVVDDSKRHRQPEGVRRMIDIPDVHPAPRARSPFRHRREHLSNVDRSITRPSSQLPRPGPV